MSKNHAFMGKTALELADGHLNINGYESVTLAVIDGITYCAGYHVNQPERFVSVIIPFNGIGSIMLSGWNDDGKQACIADCKARIKAHLSR